MADLKTGHSEEERIEQTELEQQADPRIQAIAAEVHDRGWDVDWFDADHGIELLVVPSTSGPHLFGFGVGVRLGGAALKCWVYADCDILIEPWCALRREDEPVFGDESRFSIVETLNDCLALFDRGVSRYLAEMRRYCLEEDYPWGFDPLSDYADIEPLARGRTND